MLQSRHIHYFLAVGEELNFYRAAERLHITQPALWRQIRELEDEVGVKLLDRTRRGISLTPAGAAFLSECRDLLNHMESSCAHTRRVGQGIVGTLHIACNEIASRLREVSVFLKEFREQHPEVSIQLHGMMSQQQISALRSGSIDVGFLFRYDGQQSEFQAIRLGSDHFILALSRDHPLARRTSLELKDLAGESIIMPSPSNNSAIYERLLNNFRNAGLVPHITHYADSENTLLNMVTAGIGIAFMTSSIRNSIISGAVLRPVSDLSIPVHLDMIWRSENENPSLQHFVKFMKSAVSEYSANSLRDAMIATDFDSL
jgi:DNA-binding transcriptional LysR family regulator